MELPSRQAHPQRRESGSSFSRKQRPRQAEALSPWASEREPWRRGWLPPPSGPCLLGSAAEPGEGPCPPF